MCYLHNSVEDIDPCNQKDNLDIRSFEILRGKNCLVLCEGGRGDLISIWDSGVLKREVVKISEKGSKCVSYTLTVCCGKFMLVFLKVLFFTMEKAGKP